MAGLIAILGTVPDPRTGDAQRHDLLEVLTIALVASICGCQTCVDMADFAEDREALFREFLRLEHGLPSHDTFSRLFRLIDPEALSAAFGGFLDALGTDGRGVVAIDGKTWLFSDRRYAGEPAMPGLATLAMVTSTVERDRQTTTATRYYLSSASLTPKRFAEAVRAHRAIENSLHWVLDTAFDEDRARSRKDHGAQNLATLRKLALNVLRTARPGLSIRRKRNRAGWSDAFARSIIAQMR